MPRSVGLILGTLIETFGLTLAASYFKHGLVYFFARNPLEPERETVLQRESSEFCGQETYRHIPQGGVIVSSLYRGFCSPVDIPLSTWTLRNVPRANAVRLVNTLTVRKMAIIPGGKEVTLNSCGKAIFSLGMTRQGLKNYLVAFSYTKG